MSYICHVPAYILTIIYTLLDHYGVRAFLKEMFCRECTPAVQCEATSWSQHASISVPPLALQTFLMHHKDLLLLGAFCCQWSLMDTLKMCTSQKQCMPKTHPCFNGLSHWDTTELKELLLKRLAVLIQKRIHHLLMLNIRQQ